MADFLYYNQGLLLFIALGTVLVAPLGGLFLMLCTSWVAGFRPVYLRSALVALAVYLAVLLLGLALGLGANYIGYLLWEWLNWSRDGIMAGLNIARIAIAVALVVLSAWIVNRFIPTAAGAPMGMRKALLANLIHLVVTGAAVAVIALLVAFVAVLFDLDL